MSKDFPRGRISSPDQFSLAPLLALLPVVGKVSGLPALTSSLFARYDKVQLLLKEINPDEDRSAHKRLSVEGEMLKQVLDWLALKPEESR